MGIPLKGQWQDPPVRFHVHWWKGFGSGSVRSVFLAGFNRWLPVRPKPGFIPFLIPGRFRKELPEWEVKGTLNSKVLPSKDFSHGTWQEGPDLNHGPFLGRLFVRFHVNWWEGIL